MEKNVRALARLERALLDMGQRDFRFVVVGEGAEQEWLRNNMRYAEFTGALTGLELSRTFASFDVLAFPSETDTWRPKLSVWSCSRRLLREYPRW